MASLDGKLFDVIDDQPTINAVLINLGPFKDLWESDNTEDKSLYKKYLLYMWYMNSPKSPYFNSKKSEKDKDVRKAVFGRTNYPISKKAEACIEEYVKRNTTPEIRALDAAISVCDDITDRLRTTSKSAKEFDRLIDDIDKAIAKCTDGPDGLAERILLTKQKLELQGDNLSLAKTASDLIPKLKTQIEAMVTLREQAAKSMYSLSDSKDTIENFIIDEFITESNLETLNFD